MTGALSTLILSFGIAYLAGCVAAREPVKAPVKEPAKSDLYEDSRKVEIIGLPADAMEPCITLDGKYLLFNNSNSLPDTCTYFARRIGDLRFQYIGAVPGIAFAKSREMAPSLDSKNNLFFTSMRTFGQDHKSIYTAPWSEAGVSEPRALSGEISPAEPFWINMDCAISPDGRTLIISRAHFPLFSTNPTQSDLLYAQKSAAGEFTLSPQSATILKSVNTDALEYAPCLTGDGLELYFTRCKNIGGTPELATMVARREAIDQPFGEPYVLSCITGFAEAPSLTLDKKELYFHKKDGKFFSIYRAKRKRLD